MHGGGAALELATAKVLEPVLRRLYGVERHSALAVVDGQHG